MASTREVQELSGQLNHDLREPINSIVRKLDLLKTTRGENSPLPQEGRSFLDIMSAHCAALLEAIKSLRNEVLQTSMSERDFLERLSPIMREASAMVVNAEQIHRYWPHLTEDQERYLGQVRSTARRFQKMLRALLSVASMSEPIFELTNYRNQAFTASQYILESLSETGSILAKQGVFYWHDSKASGWADQGMILAIFQNLYENSVKYRHPGRNLQIWTSFFDESREDICKTGLVPAALLPPFIKNYVRITVRDNGIGIAKAGFKRIFEPYVQLASGRKRVGREPDSVGLREEKDVGIGLYTVRKMVAAHHGYVSIESDGSSGSSFHLFMPRDPRLAEGEFSPII